MGHCLGLYHTHHMFEGAAYNGCTDVLHPAGGIENELNCDSKGDKCCDTPADPGLFYEISSDCVWTGELADTYEPDVRNIMSYTSPHCAQYFTACQAKKMRCYISEELESCLIKSESIIEISEDTEWTPLTVPHDGKFFISNRLVVKSGFTLTIDEDVTIYFGNNAQLIIEPNAILNLSGTLTSNGCNWYEVNWSGVKVYGNAEENQYYDFGDQLYHQGLLNCFPGSIIEHAKTGVELWGPDEEDTGGKISCNGTTFLNNKIGVFILPFENIVGNQPKPYMASFTDCIFSVDENFQYPSFDQHVLLGGVDGVLFSGCDFEYSHEPEGPLSQQSFGYGIAAIDAGFVVTSLSEEPQTPFPCLPGECEIIKNSTFSGLGFGILTGSYESNRLFRIYQANFKNCYTGIEVDGVSSGVILFNKFEMGSVPNSEVMNGDQVGIKLNQQIAGFTIEQDTFQRANGNVNNAIGISVENLGEANNVIRKNVFTGLTIANEAFGQNANVGDLIDGLRYVCNQNTNTSDKDFYIKNTTQYSVDNISSLQATAIEGASIATGNKFSSTGDSENGDFANFGSLIDDYLYNPNNSLENPDDTEGIYDKVPSNPNACIEAYCAPPCLSNNELTDLKESYYNNKIDYDDAIENSSWKNASLIKSQMDQATMLIIQHYLQDSISFNRDSLRLWYSNYLTISGSILLAKDYAASGNYTLANQVLGQISSRFTLSQEQEDDLEDIETIFDILSQRGIHSLTSTDISSLAVLTDNLGHASAMARSILFYHGYKRETNYVLPENGNDGYRVIAENLIIEEGAKQTINKNSSDIDFVDQYKSQITVFPNPTKTNDINVFIPNSNSFDHIQIDVWSLIGEKIQTSTLNGINNSILLPVEANGALSYRVIGDGLLLKTGRIIIFK